MEGYPAKHGILEYSIFKQTYVYANPKTIEKTIPTKIVVKYGKVNTMFLFFWGVIIHHQLLGHTFGNVTGDCIRQMRVFLLGCLLKGACHPRMSK